MLIALHKSFAAKKLKLGIIFETEVVLVILHYKKAQKILKLLNFDGLVLDHFYLIQTLVSILNLASYEACGPI